MGRTNRPSETGWACPVPCRVQHYFKEGTSLCRSAALPSGFDDVGPEPMSNLQWCKTCHRRRSAEKPASMDRENMLFETLHELKKRLCCCYEIRQVGNYGYSNYHGIGGDPKHTKGCPLWGEIGEEVMDRLNELAEEIVERRLIEMGLRAEIVGAAPRPTVVEFDDGYFYRHAPKPKGDDRNIVRILAATLGAKVEGGRNIWRDEREDAHHAEALKVVIKDGLGRDTEHDAKLGDDFSHDVDGFAVFPTKERAESFWKMGRLLRQLLDMAYENGVHEGSSVIRMLAAGKVTMTEFNKKVEKAVASRDEHYDGEG